MKNFYNFDNKVLLSRKVEIINVCQYSQEHSIIMYQIPGSTETYEITIHMNIVDTIKIITLDKQK
jgi:hypothetical protein